LSARVRGVLFPGGVRVRHFILIPPLAMALILLAARGVDRAVVPHLASEGGHDLYRTLRTLVIGLAMAAIIAFLAVQYRTGYERRLEEARDFLSRIIEGTADAIIVRDAQGRVASWNPAADAIFGWTRDEMTGRTADILVATDAETRESLSRIDAALREGHTLRNIETDGRRKDGTPVTVALTVAPLYSGGREFAGSTAIVRDVTALKQMERQLVESERLAAIGELAAVVAHEVRNPLAGIRGGCELLLEGYPKDDPRHDIGFEVIHQVDRLNRMVHDLLLYSRPKAMDPVPTDLHALLDRIVQVLQDDPDDAAVTIERRFDSPVAVVPIDGRQMEQVFMNLVLNAIQAMHHKGTVTIATRAVHDGVAVSVSDTGPGIPADALPRIFKPFFTTRAQGTGLGLAIVDKIVRGHGGTVRVESQPGTGAVFTVTLPQGA
jgi:PAS domain S-box-containing protein